MFNSKSQFIVIEPEIDLDDPVGDPFTLKSRHPMVIHSVEFVYTEATDGAIATKGVVSFDVTPSGGARAEKATYTAEISKAIGFTARLLGAGSKFDPVDIANGDTLHFELKTQQTAGEAGMGKFLLYYEMGQDTEVA